MSDSSVVGAREFAWGVVGTNRWETLRLGRTIDRDGVVREVEAGVEYALEAREAAAVALPFPRWRSRPDGRYEMDPGDSEQPHVRSLADLREALHEQWGCWRGGEPALRELDWVSVDLLRAVARLHAAGFGVGLLQPSNVLILKGLDGSEPAVVLPDFGFVRFRGVLPEWMRADVPFKLLWDKPPEWMNERCFDRTRYPKLASKFAGTADRVQGPGWDPQADLRTVARLLAWVLAPDGRVRRDIPSRDSARWSKAEVWAVLKEATEGRFADAGAFADALEPKAARPSQHFIEQIPPPMPRPPRPWRWVVSAAGGVMLAGAVVLAIQLRGHIAARIVEPPLICPECPPLSKLKPLVLEYVEAGGDQTREVAALKKMYDPAVLDTRESYRLGEVACRERLMQATLGRLAKRGEELLRKAHNEGMGQPEVSSQAGAMKNLFETLFTLRAGHAPSTEEYEPWLKKLRGLGLLH